MAVKSARKPAKRKDTIKTTLNDGSVEDFLRRVPDEKRRRDALAILKLMTSVTDERPRMWGTSIVGFGQYHYKYASGREGDMCLIGFSPRSQDVTLYLAMDFAPYVPLLKKLGKHKTGVSCLHIRKLEDVDASVLGELVARAYRDSRQRTGS